MQYQLAYSDSSLQLFKSAFLGVGLLFLLVAPLYAIRAYEQYQFMKAQAYIQNEVCLPMSTSTSEEIITPTSIHQLKGLGQEPVMGPL